MKAGSAKYGTVRLVLNLYIAIAVTVLGLMILDSAGTNGEQNRQLAEQSRKIAKQARALARTNREASLEGCGRGNFVRVKINTVSGALSQLLHRSVTENEQDGVVLTQGQEVFLDQLYRKLRPLKPVNCQEAYK